MGEHAGAVFGPCLCFVSVRGGKGPTFLLTKFRIYCILEHGPVYDEN